MAARENSKCDFCGKGSTLQCSRCKRQHYCGRECQKQDWRVHKICCDSTFNFKIQKTGAIQGYGLFAVHDFNVGDLIYGEMPLLSCPLNQEEETFTSIPKDFSTQFVVEPPIETVAQFKDVMTKYSYRDQLGNTRRLLQFSSFINHRCRFNALVIFQFGGTAHCRAARPIKAGEEITTSYISASFADKMTRWQHLKNTYDVDHCDCPECAASGREFEADDNLRQTLYMAIVNLNPEMFVFRGTTVAENVPIIEGLFKNFLVTTNLLYEDPPDDDIYNPYFLAVAVPMMMFFKLAIEKFPTEKSLRGMIFRLCIFIKRRMLIFENIDPTISVPLNYLLDLSGSK